eukprot:2685373-Alexandrium_andersonii.AAC.1
MRRPCRSSVLRGLRPRRLGSCSARSSGKLGACQTRASEKDREISAVSYTHLRAHETSAHL